VYLQPLFMAPLRALCFLYPNTAPSFVVGQTNTSGQLASKTAELTSKTAELASKTAELVRLASCWSFIVGASSLLL
jgi:X-X-X-Leu-X-X-Gly heptad repeat protein